MANTEAPASDSSTEAELTLDYLLRRMRFKSDFPALSASVSRVQAFSDSETDSMQSLSDEVLQDVALTQKLLRVVNTAHFRRAGTDPISTVSRAVALIGVGGVRNMALSLMLLDHMQDKVHAQQLKEEFLRTIMAGTLASELSLNTKESEAAYLGALFRNLGRLLVSFYLPDDAEQIRAMCSKGLLGEPAMTEEQAAQKVLGVSLDKLANKVGRMWGLPDGLLSCMTPPGPAMPGQSLKGRVERTWWLASLANEAADSMLNSEPGALGDALHALTSRYAKSLDLSPNELMDAAGRSRKRLSELTQALNLTVSSQSPAERLLDHYYVDAPHADQSAQGPSAADLGLSEEDGALNASMPLPMQDTANVLTNGIQDITNTLLEPFRLNDVLHMILETMLRALECRRVIFCLRDPKSGALLGRIGIGEGVDVLKAAFKVPLVLPAGAVPDLFSLVCLKNADMLIADAAAPNIVNRLPAWFRDHVQAPTFLLLPLTMKRKGQADMVLGMIYADKGKAGDMQINEKELSLLRTLRNQAVMAFKQTTGA